MRSEEQKAQPQPNDLPDLADLPMPTSADASHVADRVKGGVTSPRDPASGLPTGKRG